MDDRPWTYFRRSREKGEEIVGDVDWEGAVSLELVGGGEKWADIGQVLQGRRELTAEIQYPGSIESNETFISGLNRLARLLVKRMLNTEHVSSALL